MDTIWKKRKEGFKGTLFFYMEVQTNFSGSKSLHTINRKSDKNSQILTIDVKENHTHKSLQLEYRISTN